VLRQVMLALPIFGATFWHAGMEAHRNAFREFAFVTLCSLFPLIAATLFLYFDPTSASIVEKGILNVLRVVAKNDALFLYCASILSAIAWYTLKEYEGRFYDRVWFGLFAFGGYLVVYSFYGKNFGGASEIDTGVFQFSLVLYLACLPIYYAILVKNNVTVDLKKETAQSTDDFADNFLKHRAARDHGNGRR